MKFKMIVKKIVFFSIFLTTVTSALQVKAQLFLSKEEQEYINSRDTIKAVSVDGVAPLQYYDSNGQVHGISINVLNAISDLTGLTFTYQLYNTVDELKSSDWDILIGLRENNKLENVLLSYGHLQGDNVLVNISKGLTKTFRQTDIIGRIGGDEFCVYLRDVPSSEFVVSRCHQLMALIEKLNRGINVTISMGIAVLGNETSYDDLFIKADKALYEAKKNGGNQVKLSDDKKQGC